MQIEIESSDKTSAQSKKQVKTQRERLLKLKKQLKGKTFSKIKYNDIIYSLGDAVEIQNPMSKALSIGVIKKVLHTTKISKKSCWPMIEVEWLYHKQDIIALNCLSNTSFIGSFEVFRSNISEFVYIESIRRKAQLLTLEEYQTLEIVNENVFFTRASIEVNKVSQ